MDIFLVSVLGHVRTLVFHKISIVPKAMHIFGAIPFKIPVAFFRSRTNSLKICIEPQRPQIVKSKLKKDNAGGITLPDSEV